jgi:hypothetical protein
MKRHSNLGGGGASQTPGELTMQAPWRRHLISIIALALRPDHAIFLADMIFTAAKRITTTTSSMSITSTTTPSTITASGAWNS